MQDADALDDYLADRFGIDLEWLLVEAASGREPVGLGPAVRIVCDCAGCFVYEDGGLCELYQGFLTVEGVVYRFRCSVFSDAGGARFLEELSEMEPVRWSVRLGFPVRDSA